MTRKYRVRPLPIAIFFFLLLFLVGVAAFAAAYTGELDTEGEKSSIIRVLPGQSIDYSVECNTGDGFIGTAFLQKSTNNFISTTLVATFTGTEEDSLDSAVAGVFINHGTEPVNLRIIIDDYDGDSSPLEYSLADVSAEVVKTARIEQGEVRNSTGGLLMRFTEDGVVVPSITSSGELSPDTLVLPGATVPAQTAEGSIVWDTDGDLATIGTGAGRKTLADTNTAQSLSNKTLVSAVFTGGTFNNIAINNIEKSIQINANAHPGTTAGWTTNATNNLGYLATCPASQTAATLVVPITGLSSVQTIEAYTVMGQIESGGNAVTLDATLHRLSAAAADPVDASIGTLTQIAVTADTAITNSNGRHALVSAEQVQGSTQYYLLLTCTTNSATDIQILGISIEVSEDITNIPE